MNDLTEMDYVIAAISNAIAEEMSLVDLLHCAIHAKNARDFDTAVNILAQMIVKEWQMWTLFIVTLLPQADDAKVLRYNEYKTESQCIVEAIILEQVFSNLEYGICVKE